MSTPRRVLLIGPSLLLLACFDDPAPPSQSDDETTQTDGEATQTDGDGDGNRPPEIQSFEINGQPTPTPVEAAGAVLLEALVFDPDGDLDRVEFESANELLGSVDGAEGVLGLEWLLSGAEQNGTYTITATAYDQAGSVSEPVALELGVAMPEGGAELEQWTYDSGLLDALSGVAVSPDGDQVVLAGQTSTMNGSGQRLDRVVGQPWADKVTPESLNAGGVVWADGTFVVAGSWFDIMNGDLSTALFDYTQAGTVEMPWTLEGAKPALGDPVITDTPSGLERDSTGRLYAIGLYTPQSGPLMGEDASFLLAATASGDLEWLRWPS